MNERIYYSVDKIQNAIALNRKISFKYYRWELDFSGTERIVKREKNQGWRIYGFTVGAVLG